jgi:hypothetical protein
MAVETVRVIRTWDVEVDAVYKDTEDDLKAKVTDAYLDSTHHHDETRVLLPDYAAIPEGFVNETPAPVATPTPTPVA